MTKVYQIDLDYKVEYPRFYAEKNFPLKALMFGALPENWKMPKVYLSEPRLTRPNIFSLEGTRDNLVLDEKAMEHAGHVFAMSGQMFPFTYKDVITGKKEKYVFFKITKCFDCLDEKKSRLDVIKYKFDFVFYPNRIQDTPIITIPQLNSSILFAVEGIMPYGWLELKYCIDKYNLTGLQFTEVWSDGEPSSWVDDDDEEDEEDTPQPVKPTRKKATNTKNTGSKKKAQKKSVKKTSKTKTSSPPKKSSKNVTRKTIKKSSSIKPKMKKK